MDEKSVFITGAAGFVGMHFTKKLLEGGYKVSALDNLNSYYDVELKLGRLRELGMQKEQLEPLRQSRKHKAVFNKLVFYKADLEDREGLQRIFREQRPAIVVNLAAQAGVRYSLENPEAYLRSNLEGFLNILECCRHNGVKHLFYASSSSVYGLNRKVPFSESDGADHPVSFYGATKRANELFAHSYSQNYKTECTGLRFFTVYGPWGRPDMAYFKFAEKILAGETIEVYNAGKMERDFTYIDDITEGMARLIGKVPEALPPDAALPPDRSSSPYRIFNIGNNSPVKLLDFIATLEELLGKKAKIRHLPMQTGDVERTWADIASLEQEVGFKPATPLKEGLKAFVDWLLEYRKQRRRS